MEPGNSLRSHVSRYLHKEVSSMLSDAVNICFFRSMVHVLEVRPLLQPCSQEEDGSVQVLPVVFRGVFFC